MWFDFSPGVRSKPTAHVLKKQTLKPSGKSKLSLRKQSGKQFFIQSK